MGDEINSIKVQNPVPINGVPNTPKKRVFLGAIVGIIVLLVILLGVFSFIKFSGDGETSSSENLEIPIIGNESNTLVVSSGDLIPQYGPDVARFSNLSVVDNSIPQNQPLLTEPVPPEMYQNIHQQPSLNLETNKFERYDLESDSPQIERIEKVDLNNQPLIK